MKKEHLIEYCKKHEINVPSGAGKETLERLIVRAFLHNKPLKQESCFGFWEQDDNNCLSCSFESDCFKASCGIEKEKYFKQIQNQKVRIIDSMRKEKKNVRSKK